VVQKLTLIFDYEEFVLRLLTLLLVALFMYFQYALWFGDGGAIEAQLLRKYIISKESEIKEIQEGNMSLAAEVADLEQGLEAVEERARNLIGLIKEDEIFIRINENH
jgi:cell division protein FtsB